MYLEQTDPSCQSRGRDREWRGGRRRHVRERPSGGGDAGGADGGGRELFAERGYAAVGTEEIVRARASRAARCTTTSPASRAVRGRLRGGRARADGVDRASALARARADPLEALRAGARAFLDACEDPAVQRIALRRRPVGARLGALARDRDALRARARPGTVQAGDGRRPDRQQPVEPLAHLLLGRDRRGGDARRATPNDGGADPRPSRRVRPASYPRGALRVRPDA